MTAGNQPSSSGSKSAFDICEMIVSEEFHLDEENPPSPAIQSYGYAARDRIRAAKREVCGGGAQPPLNAIQFIALLEILGECAEHVTPELEARIKNVLGYHTDHDTVSSLPPATSGGARE